MNTTEEVDLGDQGLMKRKVAKPLVSYCRSEDTQHVKVLRHLRKKEKNITWLFP